MLWQVLGGRLFLHAGPRKGLKPAYIRYLNPVEGRETEQDSDDDEDSNNSEAESSPRRRTAGMLVIAWSLLLTAMELHAKPKLWDLEHVTLVIY